MFPRIRYNLKVSSWRDLLKMSRVSATEVSDGQKQEAYYNWSNGFFAGLLSALVLTVVWLLFGWLLHTGKFHWITNVWHGVQDLGSWAIGGIVGLLELVVGLALILLILILFVLATRWVVNGSRSNNDGKKTVQEKLRHVGRENPSNSEDSEQDDNHRPWWQRGLASNR